MNAVFTSPLDAFVFDHAIFGVFTLVNNFWAWVAVITAALSYWRIRATSTGGVSSATVASKESIDCQVSDACPSSSPPSEPSSTPSVLSSPSTDAKPSGYGDDGAMTVTKGKFAVYFYEECESDGDCDGDGAATAAEGGERWGSWEREMRLRTAGGWYRYQDLTVISGSVVRLWDGGAGGGMYSSS